MEIVFGVLEICVNYPPAKGGGLVTGPELLIELLKFYYVFYQFSFQKVGCRYIAG